MIVNVVVIDHPAQGEPRVVGFEDSRQAEDFAGVRGGAEAHEVEVLDEHEARRLIQAEAKERRDEERFDRMRQEG